MNRIDPTELKEILKKHMLFVTGRPNGQRANLSSQSLSGFGLDKLNLRSIIAAAADFSRCSLVKTDFSDADLYGASF